MRLKKFFTLICGCLLTAGLFTGCGGDENKSAPVIKIGMLEYLNASENQFNDFMAQIAETFSLDITPHAVTFFPNLNSLEMALESGQVDELSTYKPVAEYLKAKNPKIEVLEGHTLEFIDAFCMALRAEDTELRAAVDNAIVEMRNDGTLENLTKTYITDYNFANEPPAAEFESFDGADSIVVAITGDLPPLDLVKADGTPAGFNTAVLAEIGKRLHKNISLLQIESSARAAALTSGQADISFWTIVPISEIIPANADKPDGIELTSPYYRGRIVHVGLTK